jgi:hypothetical protein
MNTILVLRDMTLYITKLTYVITFMMAKSVGQLVDNNLIMLENAIL